MPKIRDKTARYLVLIYLSVDRPHHRQTTVRRGIEQSSPLLHIFIAGHLKSKFNGVKR